MTALLVVLTAAVTVLAVLVAGLLRAYADVLRRLHALDGGFASDAGSTAIVPRTAGAAGLPFDGPLLDGPLLSVQGRSDWQAAHDLTGQTLAGEVAAVRVVGTGQDTVLAFLSSGCTGCRPFWSDLGRGLDPAPGARLVVVTKDPAEESLAELRRLAPPHVDVLASSAAWADYAVPGSPFVVVVDGATGRVRGHGTGPSFGQLAGLLAQADADGAARGRKPRADVEREQDVDRILLAAGIGPGHPSLYPAPAPADDEAAR